MSKVVAILVLMSASILVANQTYGWAVLQFGIFLLLKDASRVK